MCICRCRRQFAVINDLAHLPLLFLNTHPSSALPIVNYRLIRVHCAMHAITTIPTNEIKIKQKQKKNIKLIFVVSLEIFGVACIFIAAQHSACHQQCLTLPCHRRAFRGWLSCQLSQCCRRAMWRVCSDLAYHCRHVISLCVCVASAKLFAVVCVSLTLSLSLVHNYIHIFRSRTNTPNCENLQNVQRPRVDTRRCRRYCGICNKTKLRV